MISVRGQMSGSAGTCPDGDRHFNVKGRGPVSISTDLKVVSVKHRLLYTVQITFIFIDFRVCDFAFAFKTQNAPCVLFSDIFQFAF